MRRGRPPPELAVATSFSIGAKSFPSACGIVKWCYSASRLVAAPFLHNRAELVVFTNNEAYVRSECGEPSARVVPYDDELVRAVRLWSNATNRTSGASRRRRARPCSARDERRPSTRRSSFGSSRAR